MKEKTRYSDYIFIRYCDNCKYTVSDPAKGCCPKCGNTDLPYTVGRYKTVVQTWLGIQIDYTSSFEVSEKLDK